MRTDDDDERIVDGLRPWPSEPVEALGLWEGWGLWLLALFTFLQSFRWYSSIITLEN